MKLILGDCIEMMKTLEENSVDSIVTDPPYGLSFMGKKWDYNVPTVEVWKQCLRVLKPGGYLLSFAGTRTQHRMACNIEDAGFEIRDMIAWVYGSGFPKSLNVGKAVDKLQGNEREDLGRVKRTGKSSGTYGAFGGNNLETKGTSPHEGWGTALKPALEPITMARKPLSEKTVAKNVLKWGTGGINIDGCRVEANGEKTGGNGYIGLKEKKGWNANNMPYKREQEQSTTQGRFPANFIHDGSYEVVELFPETSGGSASRFFYCAKASKVDRNEGCEGLEEKKGIRTNALRVNEDVKTPVRTNHHPTVKPKKLMQYLVRLVTPTVGVCLDPFMGSGSTGKACKREGFDFIGIERDEEYFNIARHRILD